MSIDHDSIVKQVIVAMKAYCVQTGNGIDAIQRVTRPEPEPEGNQVKIAMRAMSLNYRDISVAAGGYLRNDTRPVVPLSDGAGEVTAVGHGVTDLKVGDRVSPIFVRDWIDGDANDAVLRTGLGGGVDGVLAESVVLPERSLTKIPDEFSFAEAATIPCAAVTAWHALFEFKPVLPGQTVLLLGTGGVSVFALQFAKAAGAEVLMTSSSDQKLERARSLGADQTINYRQHPDWHKRVREMTSGRGVDHVVEVGGPGTMERSLKSAAVGGCIHLIGILDSPEAKITPLLSIFNLLTIHGVYVGSRAMHERTLSAMVRNQIRPIIDRSFSFDQSIEAYRYFSEQNHFGKVVIEVDP